MAALDAVIGMESATPSPLFIEPTPRLPAPAQLLLLGGSITAFCDQSAMEQAACGNICRSYLGGSFGYWLNMYAGDRVERFSSADCRETNNFGILGDTVVNIATAARLRPILANITPGRTIVIHQGGDDDIAGGDDYTTITSALRAIWSRLLGAGAVVLFVTIFPRGGGAAFNASQAQVARDINDFARGFAVMDRNPGFHVVDLDSVMVDPSQENWASRHDFLHGDVGLSVAGGSACAFAIAQVIDLLVQPRPQPLLSAADIYDPAANPGGNLLANGTMYGTSGLLRGGALGTMPTGWTLDASDANGLSAVASTTSLADGRMAITLTLSGICQGRGGINLSQTLAKPSDVSAGDILRGRMRVHIGTNQNITGVPLTTGTFENGAWCYYLGGVPMENWVIPPRGFATGGFVPVYAPDRRVGADPTEIMLGLTVTLPNLGKPFPVSATIKIADAELRKANARVSG